MSNEATQAAGHVKAAIALAQQGKLDSATTSLRAALALEFDIELADCIGRIDGLPEGTAVDLATFLPSWREDVFGDEDAFDIVVEGFDDDVSARTASTAYGMTGADDFSDLADDIAGIDADHSGFGSEAPSAREQELVPTVPIDSAEAAAAARAGALGRARYVGVAPPPPSHRRSATSGSTLPSQSEQETGSYATAPAEANWSETTEPGRRPVPLPHPLDDFGDLELAGEIDLAAQTAPPPAVEAWAEQPSVRRQTPAEPELATAPMAQPDWATPLPPPVAPSAPEPVAPALDVTPTPSYYDPLRDTPAMNPPPVEREGFGVVRNSSVRKTRTPTEQRPVEPAAAVASPPKRIDELLADAVQMMRRGDLAQADAAIEKVLEREPRNAEALNLRGGLRKQLASVRMRALEPLDRIPRQNLRTIMSSGAALTPRRMFMLNLVDGTTTLRDIIDLSGAPADEASEMLLGLVDDGLILLR